MKRIIFICFLFTLILISKVYSQTQAEFHHMAAQMARNMASKYPPECQNVKNKLLRLADHEDQVANGGGGPPPPEVTEADYTPCCAKAIKQAGLDGASPEIIAKANQCSETVKGNAQPGMSYTAADRALDQQMLELAGSAETLEQILSNSGDAYLNNIISLFSGDKDYWERKNKDAANKLEDLKKMRAELRKRLETNSWNLDDVESDGKSPEMKNQPKDKNEVTGIFPRIMGFGKKDGESFEDFFTKCTNICFRKVYHQDKSVESYYYNTLTNEHFASDQLGCELSNSAPYQDALEFPGKNAGEPASAIEPPFQNTPDQTLLDTASFASNRNSNPEIPSLTEDKEEEISAPLLNQDPSSKIISNVNDPSPSNGLTSETNSGNVDLPVTEDGITRMNTESQDFNSSLEPVTEEEAREHETHLEEKNVEAAKQRIYEYVLDKKETLLGIAKEKFKDATLEKFGLKEIFVEGMEYNERGERFYADIKNGELVPAAHEIADVLINSVQGKDINNNLNDVNSVNQQLSGLGNKLSNAIAGEGELNSSDIYIHVPIPKRLSEVPDYLNKKIAAAKQTYNTLTLEVTKSSYFLKDVKFVGAFYTKKYCDAIWMNVSNLLNQ